MKVGFPGPARGGPSAGPATTVCDLGLGIKEPRCPLTWTHTGTLLGEPTSLSSLPCLSASPGPSPRGPGFAARCGAGSRPAGSAANSVPGSRQASREGETVHPPRAPSPGLTPLPSSDSPPHLTRPGTRVPSRRPPVLPCRLGPGAASVLLEVGESITHQSLLIL